MNRSNVSEAVGVAPFVAVSHLSVAEAGRAALVAAFTLYMRSDVHRRSHARMPDGPSRARPRLFHRYKVIAR